MPTSVFSLVLMNADRRTIFGATTGSLFSWTTTGFLISFILGSGGWRFEGFASGFFKPKSPLGSLR